MEAIVLQGVKTHNLKNFNLVLPRNRLIVITGVSGSGKSSLAFDTLYAEGQRRYVESLSAYARQFLSIMEKPEVDKIDGLSPTIAIDQKTTSHNPRSTVGTVTEIYDYLRLLFARVGVPYCPEHRVPLKGSTVSQIVDSVLALPSVSKIQILAPILEGKKLEARKVLENLSRQGFLRVRIDGIVQNIEEVNLSAQQDHLVEVVIDRLTIKPESKERLMASIELGLKIANGKIKIASENQEYSFSTKFACPTCNYTLPDLEPRMFSFNNIAGACPACNGLGSEALFKPENIIVDEHLSIAQGAIGGWGEKHHYFFSLISSLAQHYHFSLDQPYCQLEDRIKQVLWYGSGVETLEFCYSFGNKLIRKVRSFEGILAQLRKRYFNDKNLPPRQQEELASLVSYEPCTLCNGSRLRKEANAVIINQKNIGEITQLNISQAIVFFNSLELSEMEEKIAQPIVQEIKSRLKFLLDVGLDYLSLERPAETLSGGEAQRIRLASQLGSGLVGILYILDEPTVGLHPRDTQRLIHTLVNLKNLGNTVIVVEHDIEIIKRADLIVDIGPLAGKHGGRLCFCGRPEDLFKANESLTGRYLSGKIPKTINQRTYQPAKHEITLVGAKQHNLKNITVRFPLGFFICVTGVSGSGKSSLINDLLWPLAARKLNRATVRDPLHFERIEGLEYLDKVIAISQAPIGRTPRSNPVTYTGVFSEIRELFAKTSLAKARGYSAGRFSFNLHGGRCEACQGDGLLQVKMHFLPDVYVTCETCQGTRYNRETLEISYKGKNIAEILAMTIEEASSFFASIPGILAKLKTLQEVGLGYLTLGQSATTLSGGEAQRVKLAKELLRRATGKTLYLLDEPTTGLHFHDVNQLLKILLSLRDQGNTIIVIEHNLEVIKNSDWIIDLGPEGGDKGGEIVDCGTPKMLKQNAVSYTGKFLD